MGGIYMNLRCASVVLMLQKHTSKISKGWAVVQGSEGPRETCKTLREPWELFLGSIGGC